MPRSILCLAVAALCLGAGAGSVPVIQWQKDEPFQNNHQRSLRQGGGNTCETAECREGLLDFFVTNVGPILMEVGDKCGSVLEFGVVLAQTCAGDLETVTPDCECSAECTDAVSEFTAECFEAVRDAMCSLSDSARAEGVEVVDAMQNFGKSCNPTLIEESQVDLNCRQDIEPYSAEKVCGAQSSVASNDVATGGAEDEDGTDMTGRRLQQSAGFPAALPPAQSAAFFPDDAAEPAAAPEECVDPAPCREGVSDWLVDNAVDLLAEVDTCDLIGLATALNDVCGAELLKGVSCPCSEDCQEALLEIEPACVASLGEFMCSRAVEAREDGVELKETVVSLTERCYNPKRTGEEIIDASCPDVPPLVVEEVCPPPDEVSPDEALDEEDSEDDGEGESKGLVETLLSAAAAVGAFFGGIVDAVKSVDWPWN